MFFKCFRFFFCAASCVQLQPLTHSGDADGSAQLGLARVWLVNPVAALPLFPAYIHKKFQHKFTPSLMTDFFLNQAISERAAERLRTSASQQLSLGASGA
jgi:hypothetical protein